MENEEYLGDGLYVSFDGIGITLRAPRTGGDHFVYLEMPVLDAFEQYVAALQKRAEERAKAALTTGFAVAWRAPTPTTGASEP